MNVLVTYATRHGSTAGMAERIAEVLAWEGTPPRAVPVEDAGVHVPQAQARPAVRTQPPDALAARPVWLFSSGPLGPDQLHADGHHVRAGASPGVRRPHRSSVPRGERELSVAYDPPRNGSASGNASPAPCAQPTTC